MSSQKFSERWNGLPDPRRVSGEKPAICNIVINEGLWAHNDYKHLKDQKQPWWDLLPPLLHSKARALANRNGAMPDKVHTLHQIAQVLRHQVRECLERPLVLLFDLYRARTMDRKREWLCERWLLVLPGGALFRVKRNNVGHFAESCFFPGGIRQPQTRWLDLVEELVLAFGKMKEGQRLTRNMEEVLPPGHGRHGIRSGEAGQCFRFVVAESWGFGDNAHPGPWCKTAVPPWVDSDSVNSAPSHVVRLTAPPRHEAES